MLVDTSVWIEVLRGRGHDRFRFVLDADEVVTCLPIIQEVLQGFDNEGAFRAANLALSRFPILEPNMTRDLYDEAIDLYRQARRAGITVRSSVDCLIAACARRNRVSILHKDRDFDGLSRVIPLATTRF